jgi:hypothetical protein
LELIGFNHAIDWIQAERTDQLGYASDQAYRKSPVYHSEGSMRAVMSAYGREQEDREAAALWARGSR